MSTPNVIGMRRALAELGDYLEQAVTISADAENERFIDTAARLDRDQSIVDGYIRLARFALERFEEAARGA